MRIACVPTHSQDSKLRLAAQLGDNLVLVLIDKCSALADA